MKRVAKWMLKRVQEGRPGEAVRWLGRSGRELQRTLKEEALQAVIDQSTDDALGKRRGERRRGRTPWSCRACGPRHGDQVRRNGHYRRRPLVREGRITLRVPQLVCVDCGKAVPFTHPLLPRRQRLWLDVLQTIVELYMDGASYRAVKQQLERQAGTSIGLMSIWRGVQTVAEGNQAPRTYPPAVLLGVDEVHVRVRGEKRWLLSVRAQDADGGKHWVGSMLSADRTQEAWEALLMGLDISRYNPSFSVISDGDRAIEEAVSRALPGARLDRCVWHLKHNAAEWIRGRYPGKGEEDDGQRKGLMAAVHSVVDAPTLQRRREDLDVLHEAVPWLAKKLEAVLDRVLPATTDSPRTNNIMERRFREWRRRTRPMDGFGSHRGVANFHYLWMLKDNAQANGRDYLPELIP